MTDDPLTTDVGVRLHGMLCDLLLLDSGEVRSESLLIGDLDVDSIALIELSFGIEEAFDVEFPHLKANEETLTLPLPDALRRMESMPGGTTFFEYVKEDLIRDALLSADAVEDLAARLDVAVPAGLEAAAPLAQLPLGALRAFPEDVLRVEASPDILQQPVRARGRAAASAIQLGEGVRERLFRSQRVGHLAAALGGRLPAGFDPDASLGALRLIDLFQLLTVRSLVGYVDHLVAARTGDGARVR